MAKDQRAFSTRRSFCWTLAGVVLAPGIATAQGSKVRRIGVLESGVPDPPEVLWKEAEPLRKLGWVEGENLHVERRYDNGRTEALQSLAEELVRAQLEIIVTQGTPATLAAKQATSSIPIIFKGAGDPVSLGLVASLARPGGNVTGISHAAPEMTAKSLSLLKELLPGLQRVGVVRDEGSQYLRATREQFERVFRSLNLLPIIVEIGAAGEADAAIAQLTRQGAQALMLEGAFAWDHRLELVAGATEHGLPTMPYDPATVREAGALIAYTISPTEQDRIRAEYIDRILRGARPADLPVRQPTKFELVINLKTAKALGITVPPSLLVRADEVIR